MLDHFLDLDTIVKLHKNIECDKINSTLNKYSNKGGPIDKIIDQTGMFRNTNY